ncbi:ABC transporter ATP-binding protein [Amycolatopsis sp. BJA-103]|uniref:ABC transporter ATP-binding protein n=1 Tax=unclassified Amycolatopsis TaxID=2618356 RepID=UPI000C7856FD|nr:ABC transporter ATP-binding protein [Amycolatopsis sp. BJA-103]AUI64481.1 iron ABC transporter permease [Amycolatopsis sp. BJA-103]PNE14558.1 iron ABC transporter permease [Amycolatopsis sp. BJA-103]
MIRTLLGLIPGTRRRTFRRYLVLAVFSVLLRAVGVVLLVPLVGALFGADAAEALPWLGALAAVTAAGWAVDAVVGRLGFELGFGVLDHAQHDVAEHLTNVRLSWLDSANTQTARQAIAATGPDLVGLVGYLLTPLIGAVLLPIAIALALLAIAWPLGLAALAGVPVLLGALWATGRITRRADRAAAEANTVLTERIVEFARTQQTLRAARRVEPARSHAGAALAAHHGATVRLLRLQIPGQVLFGIAGQLALVLLAGTTVLLATQGELGVPEAIALIVVLARYLEPFTALGDLAPGIETATTTLGRIRTVLTAPVAPAGEAVAPGKEAPRIRFEDVGFRYSPGTEDVLENFALTLEPGTTTAIVGPSGSGKSTVLALLAGLHQPTGGRVLVGGTDLAELSAADRRELVTVVFQQPYLFDGSVRDNVLAGDPSATEERVAEVVELARVGELLAHTAVGEAGGALSGGERQRVSIARALLKPAPVLLVDEATSALDTENEDAVVRSLSADPVPRTRVIVTHRIAGIRHADRVLFLEGGKITEDGTVEELLARQGRFAEFWRRQIDATGWRITAR